MREPGAEDLSHPGKLAGVNTVGTLGVEAQAQRQIDTREGNGPFVALSWFPYGKAVENHRTSCPSRGSALEKDPREAVGYRVAW